MSDERTAGATRGERQPPNEKPLKIDTPADVALRRFMQAPPMPKEARPIRPRGKAKKEGDGT